MRVAKRLERLVLRQCLQIANERLFGLSVTIDTAIALLKRHQRPGDVKVNQAVAETMQIKTFTGNVGCEHQTHGRIGLIKALDSVHEILVAVVTFKNDDLFFLEGKCSRQMCFQEGKRLTTFGEDNQTILGIFFVPTEFRTISSVKQIDETLEFAEILNLDRLKFGQEVFECRNVVGKRLARCLVVLSTQLFESVFDCRNTGLRA